MASCCHGHFDLLLRTFPLTIAEVLDKLIPYSTLGQMTVHSFVKKHISTIDSYAVIIAVECEI